jgi:hypothetical protein
VSAPLADDLNDLTAKVLGLRDGAEARAEWPSILARLERIRDRIKARRLGERRSPAVDVTCD